MRTASQRKISLACFLLLLGLVTWVVAAMVRPYLLSILMGGIVAVIATPTYERLRAKGCGCRLAALVVTLFVVLVAVGPFTAFAIAAARRGQDFLASLGGTDLLDAHSLRAIVRRLLVLLPEGLRTGFGSGLEKQVLATAGTLGGMATDALLHVAANIPEILLQVTLASVACYFFLIDGRRFAAWLGARLPLDGDVQTAIMKSFCATTVRVIWASVVTAVVQAGIVVAGWIAVGLPGAIVAGGGTFLMSWFPIVGTTPIWAGATLYLFTEGHAGKALTMLVVGLIAGVSDNVVRPFLLKDETCDMHPLVSLAAIFGGIEMFGIFGVVLGPILAAIFVYLLQIWPIIAMRLGVMSTSWERLESLQRTEPPEAGAPVVPHGA